MPHQRRAPREVHPVGRQDHHLQPSRRHRRPHRHRRYAEGTIPPYYDSLIAKLVVRGKDRNEAIQRMSRALGMFIVEGIFTTIPCTEEFSPTRFSRGNFDTGFIERFLAKGK